ncbi:hypothetical protein CR513_44845, partial [Mucuna pruriens]
MVQPQNKKKKHSMETRTTDSNAVTTLHTSSSTIDTLITPDHLINLSGDHRGVMYDANIPDTLENSHIAQRNVDAITPSFSSKGVLTRDVIWLGQTYSKLLYMGEEFIQSGTYECISSGINRARFFKSFSFCKMQAVPVVTNIQSN